MKIVGDQLHDPCRVTPSTYLYTYDFIISLTLSTLHDTRDVDGWSRSGEPCVCVNLAAAQRIQRVALKKNRERESSVSVERTKSNGHIGLVKQ
jgi:hypothetical protein